MTVPKFFPGEETTHVPSPFVKENTFLTQPSETEAVPTYEEIRDLLPEPFWDGHEDTLEAYTFAWKTAFGNLRVPTPGSGFVSRFIDAAFNGYTFMWDSSFMLMFGKYGIRAFDFQKTLDNFYSHQHPDGFISREIHEQDGSEKFTRFDPVSTGPNILPWSEWEYFLSTGNVDRLRRVFPPLLAYHTWLMQNRTWRDGTYWSSGFGCGMDNQPRLPEGANVFYSHGHMVWADACFQMLLSGGILIRMARLLGRENDVLPLIKEQEHLGKIVNECLWDEESAFYYDLWPDGRLNMVKSVGSYWALLTDVVPKNRMDAFVAHLENVREFNRPHRVPSLSADHPAYDPHGAYWCGGVWAPTSYMVLRGLDKHGFRDLAYEIARSSVENVTAVYKETGTLFENYAPEFVDRGRQTLADGSVRPLSKPDFVGWSGLFPITFLFEFVFGLRPDAAAGTLVWDVRRTEKHGVRRYPFGAEGLLSLQCEQRASETDKPCITVHSNVPLTLEILWAGGRETMNVLPE